MGARAQARARALGGRGSGQPRLAAPAAATQPHFAPTPSHLPLLQSPALLPLFRRAGIFSGAGAARDYGYGASAACWALPRNRPRRRAPPTRPPHRADGPRTLAACSPPRRSLRPSPPPPVRRSSPHSRARICAPDFRRAARPSPPSSRSEPASRHPPRAGPAAALLPGCRPGRGVAAVRGHPLSAAPLRSEGRGRRPPAGWPGAPPQPAGARHPSPPDRCGPAPSSVLLVAAPRRSPHPAAICCGLPFHLRRPQAAKGRAAAPPPAARGPEVAPQLGGRGLTGAPAQARRRPIARGLPAGAATPIPMCGPLPFRAAPPSRARWNDDATDGPLTVMRMPPPAEGSHVIGSPAQQPGQRWGWGARRRSYVGQRRRAGSKMWGERAVCPAGWDMIGDKRGAPAMLLGRSPAEAGLRRACNFPSTDVIAGDLNCDKLATRHRLHGPHGPTARCPAARIIDPPADPPRHNRESLAQVA
jgi:hypothetical protein